MSRPTICRVRAATLTVPAVLVLLAALPRLINPLAVDPFVDEVDWLHWAVDLFVPGDPSTFWTPLAIDGRPPLHYWLLLLTRDVADNAFVAGRAAAALASAACAPALYALGRLLLSERAGLLAGLLWALSPFGVVFGRIASSDDVLLTLCAILTALAAAIAIRRPSMAGALACGFVVGLAILTKTLGVLHAVTIVLAVVVLTTPGTWPRLVRPGLGAGIVVLAVLAPLVPWLPRLYSKAARHADLSGLEAPTELGPAAFERLVPGPLAATNLGLAADLLVAYLGLPVLLFALLGVVLAPRRDRRAVLFLALISSIGLAVTVAFSTSLFSRYLLSFSYPLYLLAASGIVRLAELARYGPAWLASRRASAVASSPSPALLVVGLGVGAATALAPGLPFTFRLVTSPEQAPWPARDRGQYYESWQSLYGLGQVADFLRREAGTGSVTVLVPRRSSEMRVLLPHQALRLYLRRDPAVRFVEEPTLWRAESLRELRPWVRVETPTFLVTNGTHAPDAGSTPDIPGYTRRLEASIARDLPRTKVVLHIPRPTGRSWLTVYRIDAR